MMNLLSDSTSVPQIVVTRFSIPTLGLGWVGKLIVGWTLEPTVRTLHFLWVFSVGVVISKDRKFLLSEHYQNMRRKVWCNLTPCLSLC